MMICPGVKVRYLLLAEGVYAAVFGCYFPGKIFVSVRCVYILTFHCSIRVSILVYAGVGSGYSVWMLVRCMVSYVLVFASTFNSAVHLVAWQGCCVCPVLHEYCSGKSIYTHNGQIQISYLGNSSPKTATHTPSASNRYLTFNPGGYHHKVTTNYNY